MGNNISLEELHPTYQAIARVIGIENALKLGQEFGGEGFYLPKLNINLSKARDKKIIEEFNGSNLNELAKKYGVTTRWVRTVLKKSDVYKTTPRIEE